MNHLQQLQRLPKELPAIKVMPWANAALVASMERQQEQMKIHMEERDAVQATRPEGCWCLGLGGTDPRPISDTVYKFFGYCICPDGIAAKAAADAEEERQHEERRQRRIAGLIASANIPSRMRELTFASYPVSDATRPGLDLIRHWAENGAGLRYSLFIHGPTGVGKTGLAVATQKRIIEDTEEPSHFWTTGGFLNAIKSTFNDGERVDHLYEAQTVSTLVLDDFGTENATPWAYETLFELINHRHGEDLVTIITSNFTLDELAKRMAQRLTPRREDGGRSRSRETSSEGQLAAERLIFRIREMAEVVHLVGPNLRDPDESHNIKRRAVAAAEDVVRTGKP